MKFCDNCGNPVEYNENFCNKCGNQLFQNKQKNNKIKSILIGIAIGSILLVIVFLFIFLLSNKNIYYFDKDDLSSLQDQKEEKNTKNKYQTIVIHDNAYEGVDINDKNDAYLLIKEDSISQKDNCPEEIRAVEDEIINKYNITAVNLCEMDLEFSKEIANVLNNIYIEYPSVKGYLTNITLANFSLSEKNIIAVFMPMFIFASSTPYSKYQYVFKTQVILNSSYFLNPEKLESIVNRDSKAGHFPKNATKYSPVAHELGHYLSFIALMKKYKNSSVLLLNENNQNQLYEISYDFKYGNFSLEMITEAYNNYIQDTKDNITMDKWRATISAYAVTKDNTGNYIYDETIAEAFHDVYLNGNNAKEASKYITSVLKKKLEG